MSFALLNSNQVSSTTTTANSNGTSNGTSPIVLSSIRKRKCKFTIKVSIQELLSVPYVNGVLFCKVRLCQGGSHVSFSSKKEVANSSVSWSNDAPIVFDVKTVQLYTPTISLAGTNSQSNTSQSNVANSSSFLIVGYEPCYCRISVRKEARGGKSYQKLGYVDYNLTDFILKHQQERMLNVTASKTTSPTTTTTTTSTATTNNTTSTTTTTSNNNNTITSSNSSTSTTNSQQTPEATTTSNESGEFYVNRILKEYESKKSQQQRSDNSFLKIKIKIIDSNASSLFQSATLANANESTTTNESRETAHRFQNLDSAPSSSQTAVSSSAQSQVPNANDATSSSSSSCSITPSTFQNSTLKHSNNLTSLAFKNSIQQQQLQQQKEQQLKTNSSSHSRNSSSSITFSSSIGSCTNATLPSSILNKSNPNIIGNSIGNHQNLNNNNFTSLPTSVTNVEVTTVAGHNRSCSNGSIKSNISFDFMIKNRNKKFLDELQSTSSSSMTHSILSSNQIQSSQQKQSSQPSIQANTTGSSTSTSSTTSSQSAIQNSISNSSNANMTQSSQQQSHQQQAVNSNHQQHASLSSMSSQTNTSTSETSEIKNVEPPNLRIIESRIDVNEVIAQIENELANRVENIGS